MPAKPQKQKPAQRPLEERERFESIIDAMLLVKPKPKKRKRQAKQPSKEKSNATE